MFVNALNVLIITPMTGLFRSTHTASNWGIASLQTLRPFQNVATLLKITLEAEELVPGCFHKAVQEKQSSHCTIFSLCIKHKLEMWCLK